MKSPEEIKKWLKCLAFNCGYDICGKCEYDELCKYPGTALQYAPNALAYIEQLEERIDLMKLQMRGDCGTCKHRDEYKETCRNCLYAFDGKNSHWEYEGFPWERTDGHEKPV